MLRQPPRGLFISGTGSDVGKTYVTALLARHLCEKGWRVGVYKPVASGCRMEQGRLVSDDAVRLWEAAGKPATPEDVAPQRFAAPLAPHLAAKLEGKQVDSDFLRRGIEFWADRCNVVLVEGAGGLLSPLSPSDYAADIAADLGYPVLLVADNSLGVIHQVLASVLAANGLHGGLPLAGIVLNRKHPPPEDLSVQFNAAEIRARCPVPVLADLPYGAASLPVEVDWNGLARPPR